MPVKKNYMRIFCPHCNEEIEVVLATDAITKRKPGPPSYDPGPEVDEFIIEAMERRKLTLRTIAELLTEKDVPTAKGGRWSATGVQTLYRHALERKQNLAANS